MNYRTRIFEEAAAKERSEHQHRILVEVYAPGPLNGLKLLELRAEYDRMKLGKGAKYTDNTRLLAESVGPLLDEIERLKETS